MSMIESIASLSTNISMSNVSEKVSISVLKGAMEQSEENIMKILDMPTLSPAPSGTTVDYIV